MERGVLTVLQTYGGFRGAVGFCCRPTLKLCFRVFLFDNAQEVAVAEPGRSSKVSMKCPGRHANFDGDLNGASGQSGARLVHRAHWELWLKVTVFV